MQRREFAISAAAVLTASALPGCALRTAAHPKADKALTQALADIEARSGARLGVHVCDAASGGEAGWRSQERFAMCSTFKTLLAARVLYLAQQGLVDLALRVDIPPNGLQEHAPATRERAGQPGGMTVLELCEAAVTVSDNTAANLMLAATGGPQGLTAWLREIGDKATRLDRTEPALNAAEPGDERDTTTPLAMCRTWRALLLGDVLKGYGRAMLQQWLVDSRTGDRRLRAGLPAGWRAGGKTGTGGHHTFADTLIAWPNEKAEGIIISAYLTGGTHDAEQAGAVLAQVGSACARWRQQAQAQ